MKKDDILELTKFLAYQPDCKSHMEIFLDENMYKAKIIKDNKLTDTVENLNFAGKSICEVLINANRKLASDNGNDCGNVKVNKSNYDNLEKLLNLGCKIFIFNTKHGYVFWYIHIYDVNDRLVLVDNSQHNPKYLLDAAEKDAEHLVSCLTKPTGNSHYDHYKAYADNTKNLR